MRSHRVRGPARDHAGDFSMVAAPSVVARAGERQPDRWRAMVNTANGNAAARYHDRKIDPVTFSTDLPQVHTNRRMSEPEWMTNAR